MRAAPRARAPVAQRTPETLSPAPAREAASAERPSHGELDARLERASRLGHRLENLVIARPPDPPAGGAPEEGLPFRAIAADPEAEDGAAFFGREDLYTYPSLGFTTRIREHEGPDVEYNAEEDDGEWTASPEVTASDEGTNDSWALEEGTHAVPDDQADGAPTPLYVRVSAPMAAQIAAAEEEHNADYRYAAAEILTKADAWLDQNLADDYGPAASEDAVTALVDQAINAPLQAHLGLTGVEDFDWANLTSYYGKATAMTETRDTEGWHDFGHNAVNEIIDEKPATVHVITDGDTEIGTHPSADVVKLDEVE